MTIEHQEPDKKHGGVLRIHEQDFTDVYDQMKIQKDLAYVKKRRESFEKKQFEDNAEDMEWGIAHGAAGYDDWFQDFQEPYTDVEDKEPFTVFAASEYDDISARTDIIMVLNNAHVSGAVLSLDATSSRDPDVIEGKFGTSRKSPGLPFGFEELTYVDAGEEAGVRGKVAAAPHFVVGVNADDMSDFRSMVIHGEKSPKKERLERSIAVKIIGEMQAQAVAIEAQARQSGSQEHVAIIEPILQYLTVALDKAQRAYIDAGGEPRNLDLDTTYNTIMLQSSLKTPSRRSRPKLYDGVLPEDLLEKAS
jgi:hypothetical protein